MQPMQLANLFTNPDGTPCQRPCLFGIRPGKTTYADAVQKLQMHPFTCSFERDIQRGVFSGPGLSVIVFQDGSGLVSRIDLVHPAGVAALPWASLGQVVTLLGIPVVAINVDTIRSYYPSAAMMFFHTHHVVGYVSPEDGFDDLFVFAAPRQIPADAHLIAWQGFSSVRHYLARTT
jgi:hypothetical protein